MNYKIEQNKNGTFKINARIQINGKPYRKQDVFTGSKRNADRRGSEMVRELEEKAEADQKARVGCFSYFKECIDFYMEQKEPKRGDKTYFDRLKKEIGTCELEEVPEVFERFMNFLSRSKTNRGTPYSSATKNRYRAWITAILNFAVENGKIEKSPLVYKIRKEKETPRDRSLTSDEISDLFIAIETYRPYLRPLVQFLMQIPCRKAEVLNARRFDLDLKNSILRIRSGTTKNGRGINKPIPPNMDEYFRSIPAGCPWVFYREVNGEYFQLKEIDTAWRFCLEKAGIENFRLHDTRHISATEMVNNGIPERQVMDVAGWSTNMLSTYYHRSGSETVQSVRAMLSGKNDSEKVLSGTD